MAANPTGVGGHEQGWAKTYRRDQWWVGPAATAAGLTAWLIYYAWAAWQDAHFACLLYTSPSPRDVEESRMPSSA